MKRWSSARHRRPAVIVITNWRDRKHPEAGGAEAVCEHLAKGFVDQGHEVVLLTSAVAGEYTNERVDGYLVHRRGGRFTVYPWALVWLFMHRRRIRAVVDSQNGIPFFTPLAVSSSTPVLLLMHHVHQDQFPLYFPPVAARVGQWLEKQGSRAIYRDRSIIAVSPSTRESVRRRLGLRGDIVVIPPGSESVVAPLPGRRGRSGTPRIVCVGRLVVHKCTSSIVEAMPAVLQRFPDLELHLVGDGPEREALEELVEKLELEDSVVIHGSVSMHDRDQLMRSAWLSVNASEGEGWGLSVVEANALGVPVLAFRRPGLRDSIRDGETGWLIDEGMDLGSAMSRALAAVSDEVAAEEIGVRARQWASQFTWEEMTNQVLTLLKAEAGRLEHVPDDRRVATDVGTIVAIPPVLFPGGDVPTFRAPDRCLMSQGSLLVLLRGTDTQSARSALRRAGFSQTAIDDPRLVISVARPVDLVSPAVSASPVRAVSDEEHEDSLTG